MDDVKIAWDRKGSVQYLRFTFIGKLSTELAENAIRKWDRAFESKPMIKVNLIWNCLEMTSYHATSANLWKKALDSHSERIDEIWVVTKNPLIRMGAKAITAISHFKLKAVTSESEIAVPV